MTGASPSLRIDAQANRDRIVKAAREAFATSGIDVPLSAIARKAGVGAATLYRRFPTRSDLVAEAFTEQITECTNALADAVADPDPWHGLCQLVTTVCAAQARDRGFSAAFISRFPEAIDVEEAGARAERELKELVRGAKASGKLRHDFDHTDVFLLMLANDGVVSQSADAAQATSRRLVSYFLQAARARQQPPLPPPGSITLADLHQS